MRAEAGRIAETRERVVELLQKLAGDAEENPGCTPEWTWDPGEAELLATAVWLITGEDRRGGEERRERNG